MGGMISSITDGDSSGSDGGGIGSVLSGLGDQIMVYKVQNRADNIHSKELIY